MNLRIATGTLLLLAFVTLGVVVDQDPPAIDQVLRDVVGTSWQGGLGIAATIASAILGPVLPILLGVGLLVATVRLRRQGDTARASVTFRVTVLLAACRMTSVIAKPLLERDRPRAWSNFSYPSGHVASVASTGFAAVVLCLWLAPRIVRRVWWIAVVATALAGVARVALGVHWLTDTVGSILGVVGVGLLVGTALRLFPPPDRGVGSTG